MALKNIEALKMLVLKKEVAPTTSTMHVNAIINPPAPHHAGEDITEKLNKLYLEFIKKYYQ